MAAGPYYLAFWSRRTTATVLPASSAAQARQRATARRRAGYGNLVSVQRAGAADTRPQFGSAQSRSHARAQRSRYRPWL